MEVQKYAGVIKKMFSKWIVYIVLVILIYFGVYLHSVKSIEDVNPREYINLILLFNLQSCDEIDYIGKEFGEGTYTVTFHDGKIYLLSISEHCYDFYFNINCWNVKSLKGNVL
jgi:hypothetical protein